MTNPVRGEVALSIDGRARTLCLTLGALAELEAAFGAADLQALGARLSRMSARDLIVVLDALLRGGGEAPPDDLASVRIDWAEAASAAASCFRLAFAR